MRIKHFGIICALTLTSFFVGLPSAYAQLDDNLTDTRLEKQVKHVLASVNVFDNAADQNNFGEMLSCQAGDDQPAAATQTTSKSDSGLRLGLRVLAIGAIALVTRLFRRNRRR